MVDRAFDETEDRPLDGEGEDQLRPIDLALVRAGEERLRGLGAVRLTAIVVEGDAAAAGLWEAVGYEAQAERLRFIRMLDG